MILADIAEYVTDKISSNDVSLNNYVTTDSLLYLFLLFEGYIYWSCPYVITIFAVIL